MFRYILIIKFLRTKYLRGTKNLKGHCPRMPPPVAAGLRSTAILRLFYCLHTKMGPSKVGYTITPPLILGRSLGCFPMGVPNKTSTSNRSLGILVTIPNHCGWNLPIRRRGSIFRAERISQLRTLSRSVNSRTLRKISSLSTILKIALFQSVSTIYSHTCRSEQRSFKKLTALRCLKALVLWSQSDKVHSQLRSLYRSVYQSRSVFGHLWIPPQGTWTSPPAVYYCFLRVACSVLLFL